MTWWDLFWILCIRRVQISPTASVVWVASLCLDLQTLKSAFRKWQSTFYPSVPLWRNWKRSTGPAWTQGRIQCCCGKTYPYNIIIWNNAKFLWRNIWSNLQVSFFPPKFWWLSKLHSWPKICFYHLNLILCIIALPIHLFLYVFWTICIHLLFRGLNFLFNAYNLEIICVFLYTYQFCLLTNIFAIPFHFSFTIVYPYILWTEWKIPTKELGLEISKFIF